MNLYECNEPTCLVGGRGVPGRFTDGATKEQITVLTGDPDPEHHGEGVCPNCGTPGKKIGTHESHKGEDPYQELHDKFGDVPARAWPKLQARAADPEDELTPEAAKEEYLVLADEAQAKLVAAVSRSEQGGDDDADA